MHKLIVLCSFCAILRISGQDREISLYDADSVSYVYFLNNETNKLNLFTDDVVKSGLDFYYLRIRTGILNYNVMDYAKALIHFERALDFEPNDTISQEYLYFSQTNLVQNFNAKSTFERMPATCRTRLKAFKPTTNVANYALDSLSFLYFNTKDVSNMTKLVNTAKGQNIDFYNLHMRAGILNFNQKRYLEAEKYFKNTLALDPNNDLIQEYLFYSYLEQGKLAESNALFRNMNKSIQSKLKKDKPTTNMINFEGGYMTSSANSVLSKLPISNTKLYEEKDVMQSLTYLHLGYFKSLKNRSSLYGGLSYSDLSKQKTISFPKDTANRYSFKQTQIYLAFTHTLQSNWELTFGLNGISYNALPTFASFDTLLFQYRFYTVASKSLNLVSNVGISKQIHPLLATGLAISASVIDKQLIFQEKLSVSFYPLKKPSTFMSLEFAISHDTSEVRTIGTLKIGTNIIKRLSNETYCNFGNMRNYNDANAFVVYNVSDKINFKIGTIFSFEITKSIMLSLRYDLLQRQSGFYTLNNDFTSRNSTYKYNNNSIIIGAKWKF